MGKKHSNVEKKCINNITQKYRISLFFLWNPVKSKKSEKIESKWLLSAVLDKSMVNIFINIINLTKN